MGSPPQPTVADKAADATTTELPLGALWAPESDRRRILVERVVDAVGATVGRPPRHTPRAARGGGNASEGLLRLLLGGCFTKQR